jgi:hypothetical protein
MQAQQAQQSQPQYNEVRCRSLYAHEPDLDDGQYKPEPQQHMPMGITGTAGNAIPPPQPGIPAAGLYLNELHWVRLRVLIKMRAANGLHSTPLTTTSGKPALHSVSMFPSATSASPSTRSTASLKGAYPPLARSRSLNRRFAQPRLYRLPGSAERHGRQKFLRLDVRRSLYIEELHADERTASSRASTSSPTLSRALAAIPSRLCRKVCGPMRYTLTLCPRPHR